MKVLGGGLGGLREGSFGTFGDSTDGFEGSSCRFEGSTGGFECSSGRFEGYNGGFEGSTGGVRVEQWVCVAELVDLSVELSEFDCLRVDLVG